MELRHLRYFIAVAEEGSLSLAAERRLHTAQPSLSKQIRDLEAELGVELLVRGPRGVEPTEAGRVLLEHARVTMRQVESAIEATRRAARPAQMSFAVGFLTGSELEWLPPVMEILREELADAAITVYSRSSPELAADLVQGKIDVAFLRPEKSAPGISFCVLKSEPLIAVLPSTHRLAGKKILSPEEVAGEVFVNFPQDTSPVLREIIDDYAASKGVKFGSAHLADNVSKAVSLVISMGGVTLLPIYAKRLLPPTVVSRPMIGGAPTIDLVLGYDGNNSSRLLKALLAKIEKLKFELSSAHTK